jgi:hypothetical protein
MRHYGNTFAECTDIGDNFNAEVGFVLRTGITDLYVAYDELQADERPARGPQPPAGGEDDLRVVAGGRI